MLPPNLPTVAGPHISAPPLPDLFGLRDDPSSKPMSGAAWTIFGVAGFAASSALVYHGYKRYDSIGGALLWLLAGIFWPVALPVALAQGFGKPKKR